MQCYLHGLAPLSDLGEEMHVTICPGGKEPWLRRMERHRHDAQMVLGLMALEDFEWHDQRVRHQICIHPAVVNVDGGVVCRGCKQRQPRMIRDRPHCKLVCSHCLVGRGGQVRVKPAEAAVIGAENQVVAPWVHGNRRDPLDRRRELLGELLLEQMVNTDVSLRRNEKERLGRVEGDGFNATLGLGERASCRALGNLVEQHGLGRAFGTHTRQVVTTVVPSRRRGTFNMRRLPHNALCAQSSVCLDPHPVRPAGVGTSAQYRKGFVRTRTIARAGKHEEDAAFHNHCRHVKLGGGVEGDASDLGAELPCPLAPSRGHFPQAHGAIRRRGE
mmetsp:Transcript_24504/g.49110  ORF Transcript_24504/g.49110 Transcript_24504/m.49110 type:complete len:330 (+) Transcript_24504:159-1148(+)